MRRAINATKLEFDRAVELTLDDNYNLVARANEPDKVKAKGSLQPFPQGTDLNIIPDGRNADTAYIYYTKTELHYATTASQIVGDTTLIKGVSYEVFPFNDWSLDETPLSYREYLLVEVEEGNVD